MRRGEVWWADFPSPIGRRPAVLLSRDVAYNIRTSVTVAPVTRTIRNIAIEVILTPEDGMPTRCAANLDSITTLSKSRLIERITQLSPEKMSEVARAVIFALDLEDQY
jgi:mRNA interferase MazF